MMDDELEQLLGRAAAQARDLSFAPLPDDSQLDHPFSELFEKKMEVLCRQQKKRRFNWTRFSRRAAAFAVVSMVGLSVLVLSVDAWRETLFEMVEKKHADYSEILFESKDGSGVLDSQFVLTEHRPAYLPEGYQLTRQWLDASSNDMVFTTPEDKMINFQQAVNAKEGFARSVGINTEGSELVPFDLNGYLGHKMTNGDMQFVLWNDNYYNYMLITQLSMEETIQIAESVTIAPESSYHPPELAVPSYTLQEDYSVNQAMQNGDVVITDGGVQNAGEISSLLAAIDAEEPYIVRITDFTVTAEEARQEQIESFQPGDPVIKELYFDGQRIHYTLDFLRAHSSFGRNGAALEVRQDADGTVRLVLIARTGQQVTVCSYN